MEICFVNIIRVHIRTNTENPYFQCQINPLIKGSNFSMSKGHIMI